MNAKSLYVLIGAAIVAVGIAIALRIGHAPRSEADEHAQPLLPALRSHVNDVTSITVTGAGDKVVATLTRGKDGWTIAERSGYPADLTHIRELLVKLDRATLVERKTSNPKRYRDIGVDDVKDRDAKGVRVDIAGLAKPVRLIVGTYSGSLGGTFVRRDGEAQSWLASGELVVAKTVAGWERRDIAEIAAARVASITLTAPDKSPLKLDKERASDSSFRIAGVPDGRKIRPGMDATLASVLSGLRIDDVVPAKDAAPSGRVSRAEYVTFDGVRVDATAWAKDGKDYAQFRAALDDATARKRIADDEAKTRAAYDAAVAAQHAPGKAVNNAKSASDAPSGAGPTKPLAASDPPADMKARLDTLGKEVDTLDRSFSGWTFVVPSYVFANMTKTMNDMLVPVETKKPESAAAAAR